MKIVKKNLIAISNMCIGLCFVFGSWLISTELRKNNAQSVQPPTPIKNANEPQLFTQSELANYLGISEKEMNQLRKIPSLNSSVEVVFPYIKIGDTIYFPKKGIDNWLKNLTAINIQRSLK